MGIAALKPLERRVRRMLMSRQRRFTGRLVTGTADAIDLGPSPRILFVRAERIGDVLISVPVIRAVRRRYPGAMIDLLVSNANAGVEPAVRPWIDHVWRYDKRIAPGVRLIRRLRRSKYDLMVDLVNGPSVTSRFVAKWSRAARVLGLLHEQPGFLTHAVPLLDPRQVHVVTRTAQLLLAFGIDPESEDLRLEYRLTADDCLGASIHLAPSSAPYRLGVNVSGRGPGKYWGRDNFVAAIGMMRELDPRFSVTVCGAPEYQEEVTAIASAAAADQVPPLSTFHEFAAIINSFDLLLTPDTSVVHLAAAWRIPLVGLFHSDPNTAPWLPYGTPHRAIVHRGPLASIPTAEVIQAMTSLIEECFGPPECE
jgi:ADP-heptose:LPS heptosyltransferase